MQIENLLVRSLVLWRLHRYVNLLLVRAWTCPFFPLRAYTHMRYNSALCDYASDSAVKYRQLFTRFTKEKSTR